MKSSSRALGQRFTGFRADSFQLGMSRSALRRAAFGYALAVLSVAAALGIKLILQHFNVGYPLSSSFLAAIAIAFWYGGKGPGILSPFLSFVVFGYFVLPHEVDYRMVLPDGSTKPVYLTANGRSEWRPDGGA
jgi:K+-sensing histidine kinase KdpD